MQKFENELDMRVELAVTNERGKWEEQTRRAWQQREQGLLTTAHQEWSKAQEIVVKAELERSKREWEREMQKTKQVIIVHCLLIEMGEEMRKRESGVGEERQERDGGRESTIERGREIRTQSSECESILLYALLACGVK